MNFNYIPLHASTKIPLHKNWANKYQTEKPSGNYGVLTGKINNIIIVDIDNKDDGLTKWEELIETHDNRKLLESEWATQLRHQMPDLPTFESFLDELKKVFLWVSDQDNEVKV